MPRDRQAPWARTPAGARTPPGPASPAPPGRAAGRARPSRTRGPAAGRHGAPAPGLRRGLAADLATMLPRGRRRLLLLLGALAIVGAGILVGMVLARGSSGTGALAGRRAAADGDQAGSAAAFTMTVPAGWQTSQQGAGTDSPARRATVSILVTPAAAGGADGFRPARRRLARGLRQGRFPGYQPIGGRPFTFQGGAGVAWQFTWQPGRGGRLEIAGHRVPARHPGWRPGLPGAGIGARRAAWAAAQPAFRQALSTFRARRDPGGLPPAMRQAASGRTAATPVSNRRTTRPAGRSRLRGCCSWSRTG